jgi:hypothetical protein
MITYALVFVSAMAKELFMRLCVDHSADKPSFLPPNLYISARTRCAFPHLDTRLATGCVPR